MKKILFIKYYQLLEAIKANGLFSVLDQLFFLNRKLFVFEKNLSSLKQAKENLQDLNSEIVNLTKTNFNKDYIKFATKSRYLKTVKNIKNGYEAFAMTKEAIVIGDVWFAVPDCGNDMINHTDLKLLNIKTTQKDVYMFDMYVVPELRGTPVTTTILKSAFIGLREKGYKKIYTYVMSENIPALWMIRTLGFEQLYHLKMRRFLFFRNAFQ